MPPLDASSSGWAWTAIRVRGSDMLPACHARAVLWPLWAAGARPVMAALVQFGGAPVVRHLGGGAAVAVRGGLLDQVKDGHALPDQAGHNLVQALGAVEDGEVRPRQAARGRLDDRGQVLH